MAGAPSAGIGYVVRKFPVLSETFILNELLALESRGVPLHVFSLERPNDPRFHEDLPRLKARVSYVPDVLEAGRLLEHHRRLRKYYRQEYSRALRYALGRVRPTLFWRFLQSGYVANEARRLKLRHLHAHFANRPTSVAFFASMLTRIPFSFTAHAMDIFKERVNPKALSRKIEAARFVVTVSDFNKAYLEERANGGKGAGKGKIVRLYNGIDLDRFSSNGLPPERPFTILCVARLVEKKGLHVLIEAAKRLRDRSAEFRVWIVGKGQARARLEELIERWKLRDRVHLLGPHTQLEVRERYRSAHLYALPCIIGEDGNRDGLPVSIVEALACGLPVVTTPVTGIPEVIGHGENGFLVPPGDAKALADAIESVIRDRGLHERLSRNARPSVASRFDLRQTACELQRLFEGNER